jgi:transposase
MYGWETHVLLRHYLEQGLSITAIAETLQVDRRTIHRWVAAGDWDRDPTTIRYGPRAAVPTKLDPYKPLIEERLTTYPELTAVRLSRVTESSPGAVIENSPPRFMMRELPRPEPARLSAFP